MLQEVCWSLVPHLDYTFLSSIFWFCLFKAFPLCLFSPLPKFPNYFVLFECWKLAIFTIFFMQRNIFCILLFIHAKKYFLKQISSLALGVGARFAWGLWRNVCFCPSDLQLTFGYILSWLHYIIWIFCFMREIMWTWFLYIRYSPEQLFDVVAAVDLYHGFVPWCQQSEIIQRYPDGSFDAELEIGFKFLVENYVSHVELNRPKCIKVIDSISSCLF